MAFPCRYFGQEVHKEAFPVLYEAGFRPAPTGAYPDRPQSPERLAASRQQQQAGGLQQQLQQQKTASAYVPPHLRGKSGQVPGGNFSLAFDKSESGPKRIPAASQQPQQRGPPRNAVPGFDFVDAPKKKGKK